MAWPTLTEVRSFLRLEPNAKDDAVISTALAAAIDYGNRRTSYRWAPDNEINWASPFPDTVHMACLEHAARLYKRRDTIDGTIGWGDMGALRVPKVDPDIEALYTAVGPMVFG